MLEVKKDITTDIQESCFATNATKEGKKTSAVDRTIVTNKNISCFVEIFFSEVFSYCPVPLNISDS